MLKEILEVTIMLINRMRSLAYLRIDLKYCEGRIDKIKNEIK